MERPREWNRGYRNDPGPAEPCNTRAIISKQSMVKDQPSILPFLRASETIRRKPADIEKEEPEHGEQELPNEMSVPGQVDERKISLSKIETRDSVLDRQLGRLRSKTVSRDSFSSFPDLMCSREDLPHPSKLGSTKKGRQWREKRSDDSKVSSHLRQMRKRLNSWEDTTGVLQLMKERRKKAKLENVLDQFTENTIPAPGFSSVPTDQFYRPVLLDANPEQECLPDGGNDHYVSRTSCQDPVGRIFSQAHSDSMSTWKMLPPPSKLRAKTKAEKPHRLNAKPEDRVHNHIAQLKRKLILSENLPAAEYMNKMLPMMSQYPASPTEGATAPDVPTMFSPYRPEPTISQADRLPPSNMWLCPRIDQGNTGTFDLYKENTQQERWYPSAGPSATLTVPVKDSPQQESANVKWPILNLSQIDSGRFALNGSTHLDQASLWHCDSLSSKYSTITRCERPDEE